MARRRAAVLISGGGSNLQALIDATARPGSSAEIILVVSNEPAPTDWNGARRCGIPAASDHRTSPTAPPSRRRSTSA